MNDEETIEILTPSAAMLPVLTGLRASLSRLGDTKTKSAPRVWDNIAFAETASEIARFELALQGFEEGSIPSDDTNTDNEIRHRLFTDFEIMSPEDLNERFCTLLDGAALSRQYRRIAETPAVARLMKDAMALGWTGFNMVNVTLSEERTLRNRRMFTDYFKADFDWTRLRALELSRAAALIEYACHADMISEEAALPYRQRITAEALVRFASWNALARALLTARVFELLSTGPAETRNLTAKTEALLEGFLAGPWQAKAWPRCSG